MAAFLDGFSSFVALLLMGVGVYFLLRLKGFYLFYPLRCMRLLDRKSSADGISPLRALTVALAGTLGVGNIVGVASALLIGGPGAVLWMVLGALVAMVLKYAEIVLAMRHRTDAPSRPAGAHIYIHMAFSAKKRPRRGRFWSAVFAALCLVNAITMGGILQTNAAAGAMEGAFSLPPRVTGGGMAVLILAVIFGGAKKEKSLSYNGFSCTVQSGSGERAGGEAIRKGPHSGRIIERVSALTEWLVPVMTVGFLLLCLTVIVLRWERLGAAVSVIVSDAFTPAAAGGGIGGLLVSRGMRAGVMRGLISNEAGAGTAPMAHAAADNESPAAQGVFGLIEVFVDTVLLCTVTALAILVSDTGAVLLLSNGADTLSDVSAVELARRAFESVLGPASGGFFALSILFFAAATVLCWGHYGSVCVSVLFGENTLAQRAFLLIFALCLPLGALFAPKLCWMLADGVIGVMTVINLGAMLMLRREVSEETRLGGLLPPASKKR